MILIAFDGKCDQIKKGKATAEGWGHDLKNDGTFRMYSQHSNTQANVGAGIQRTLREVPDDDGTLRLDLQRVIGKNGAEVDVTTYRGKIDKQFQVISKEKADQFKLKHKKVLESKEKTTVFANIWSLFGVQEGKPGTGEGKQFNRIFILNNQNLVNGITQNLWDKMFSYTLANQCSALITLDANVLPDGYSTDKCTAASKLGIS